VLRAAQLEQWSLTLTLPYTVWLPGLFNPIGLLTAIKQVTARKRSIPLEKMTLDTHATRMYRVTDATTLALYPEDGIFIHGLILEGARWTDDVESADTAYLESGILAKKTLQPQLPFLPSSSCSSFDSSSCSSSCCCCSFSLFFLSFLLYCYPFLGTTCAGHLLDSRLKQLLTPMPVMYVKAVEVQPEWVSESVGYIR
jgi:hypothetical protein